jgi:hypothetical protein
MPSAESCDTVDAERRREMSTVSHPSAGLKPDERGLTAQLLVVEMWASLAIVVMWIAVAVAAVWGPDFVSSSGSGTTTTTIPSGIAIAVFASIGTWFVAKYGFGRREADS